MSTHCVGVSTHWWSWWLFNWSVFIWVLRFLALIIAVWRLRMESFSLGHSGCYDYSLFFSTCCEGVSSDLISLFLANDFFFNVEFSNTTIIISNKSSILQHSTSIKLYTFIFIFFFFELVNVNEVDFSFTTFLIQDCVFFNSHSLVSFNRFMANPLQIVQRYFIILWQKEWVNVSWKSVIQIDYSSIHMHKYQVKIKQRYI